MRKILVLALALVFILGLTAGCGSSSGTLKVGVIAPTTGPLSLQGQEKVNALNIAAEEINSAGGIKGKKIELVVEDDQGTNPGAVSAFQKLASQKDLIAVIGPAPSTQVKSILKNIDERKLPVLIGGSEPSLTKQGVSWLFRFRPADTIASQVMISYLVSDMNIKNVAVIHDTDAFGTAGKDLVVAALKDQGLAPAGVFGYNSGTKDYTAILLNIKNSGAKAIVTYMSYPEDIAVMLQQFRQLKMDQVLIGSPALTSSITIKLAKEAAEGLNGVSDFVPEQNDVAKQFAAKYKEKFNQTPDFFASWAYDALKIMAEAAKTVDDPKDSGKLRDAIRKVQNYTGAEGVYNFDSNGDGLASYTVVKVENGATKSIKVVTVKK